MSKKDYILEAKNSCVSPPSGDTSFSVRHCADLSIDMESGIFPGIAAETTLVMTESVSPLRQCIVHSTGSERSQHRSTVLI